VVEQVPEVLAGDETLIGVEHERPAAYRLGEGGASELEEDVSFLDLAEPGVIDADGAGAGADGGAELVAATPDVPFVGEVGVDAVEDDRRVDVRGGACDGLAEQVLVAPGRDRQTIDGLTLPL